MTQHAADQFPIQRDGGHIGRQLYRHRAAAQQHAAILQRHVDHLLQPLRLRPHLNAVGVELGHFDCLADQAIEARTLLIENGEHLAPLALVERGLRQQAGRRRAYGGQRRAQFMGHRIEQRAAQAFSLARRFHPAETIESRRPLQRNGEQAADRVIQSI